MISPLLIDIRINGIDDHAAANYLCDAMLAKLQRDIGGPTGAGMDLHGRQRVERILFAIIRKLNLIYATSERLVP